jgi:hypothetical protein
MSPPFEVPRDGWGRPKIVQPAGDARKTVAYTRASTVAKTLDDTYALQKWMQRQVIKGLTVRPDLQALASGVVASGGDKDRLNGVAEQAMEAAASQASANIGTALHEWAEIVDIHGGDLASAPNDLRPRLSDYLDALTEAGVEVIDAEAFVVNDELQIGGSYDRLYRLADGRVVIGDIKTGDHAATYGAGSVAVQIALYSRSQRYWGTAERSPIHDELDLTTGLLVHLPQNGEGCRLYEVDLVAGWEAAQTAAWIHKTWRRSKPVRPI